MTKKDYILIAGRINEVIRCYRSTNDPRAVAGATEVAISLATALKQENPAFKRERFLDDSMPAGLPAREVPNGAICLGAA